MGGGFSERYACTASSSYRFVRALGEAFPPGLRSASIVVLALSVVCSVAWAEAIGELVRYFAFAYARADMHSIARVHWAYACRYARHRYVAGCFLFPLLRAMRAAAGGGGGRDGVSFAVMRTSMYYLTVPAVLAVLASGPRGAGAHPLVGGAHVTAAWACALAAAARAGARGGAPAAAAAVQAAARVVADDIDAEFARLRREQRRDAAAPALVPALAPAGGGVVPQFRGMPPVPASGGYPSPSVAYDHPPLLYGQPGLAGGGGWPAAPPLCVGWTVPQAPTAPPQQQLPPTVAHFWASANAIQQQILVLHMMAARELTAAAAR